MAETELDEPAAAELFENAGRDLRVALVMHRANADKTAAENALERSAFVVETAVGLLK
jgi:N-acetylmuramic acid 6-phosphate (MurNAc-6-P) etherase